MPNCADRGDLTIQKRVILPHQVRETLDGANTVPPDDRARA
jgi:hypothetical protein